MPHRLLITGGSGFIGTNFQELCRQRDVPTVNVDCKAPKMASQTGNWVDVDVRDGTALLNAFREFSPTHVIHLAARTDMEGKSLDAYSANTLGTQEVIRCSNATETVESVVIASTRLVTPVGYLPEDEFDVDPDSHYGQSKVLAERVCRSELRRPWLIVRPTSIWGPWFGTPYLQFFRNVVRGTYVHPRGSRIFKTFGYVENTVHQLWTLSDSAAGAGAGKTLYLGDPKIEVGEFADLIASSAGVSAPRRVPLPVLAGLAIAGDTAKRVGLSSQPPLTRKRLSNLTTDMVFELDLVAHQNGVSAEEGVRRTLKWMKSQGKLPTSGWLR